MWLPIRKNLSKEDFLQINLPSNLQNSTQIPQSSEGTTRTSLITPTCKENTPKQTLFQRRSLSFKRSMKTKSSKVLGPNLKKISYISIRSMKVLKLTTLTKKQHSKITLKTQLTFFTSLKSIDTTSLRLKMDCYSTGSMEIISICSDRQIFCWTTTKQ